MHNLLENNTKVCSTTARGQGKSDQKPNSNNTGYTTLVLCKIAEMFEGIIVSLNVWSLVNLNQSYLVYVLKLFEECLKGYIKLSALRNNAIFYINIYVVFNTRFF